MFHPDLRTASLRHLPLLAMATVWLSAVYAVSHGRTMDISTLGLGMLLLGVPMGLAGICASTLRRHRWLSASLRRRGRLYLLLSGRWLSVPLWTIWGLGISLLLLLQFHVYEPVEWAVAATTIPLFTILFAYINRRLLKAGVHSDMAVTGALAASRYICPMVLLVLQAVVMVWWGDLPQHASIETSVAAHTPEAADRSGSALVREALHWAGYFDGLKAYALTHMEPTDALGAGLLMVLAFGNYALLYFTCFALSCFQIPRAAFVRARLAPRSTKDVFIVAAVAALLIPFIYFPALAQLELIVSQSEPARVRAKVQATIAPVTRLVVEQIDDDYYLEGTGELIVRARSEVASPVGAAAERLRREVDATFDRLESEGVDEYLDWYYSLTAEWGRFYELIIGGVEHLESHLAEKVRETFEQEKWYAGINVALEGLTAADEAARKAYEQKVRDILKRNRVSPQRLQGAEVDVASVTSLEDIFQSSFHRDFIPSAHRFLNAGSGGAAVSVVVGTVIAKKIKTKILATLVLKVAAKAPLKVVTSKLLSSAVGSAAAGAAAGSIVPGLGTGIGAVGGALVGLGAGIAIDGVLLNVEEALSREDFRREIVTAIREARREFENQYLGTPVPSKSASP